MEGVFAIITIPMGVDLVLLQPAEERDIESLLGDDTICLPNWFQSMKSWNQEVVAKERSVWLIITGIPLHAWKEDFFKFVVSIFGKFVDID